MKGQERWVRVATLSASSHDPVPDTHGREAYRTRCLQKVPCTLRDTFYSESKLPQGSSSGLSSH